jgi:hypothetical protein
MSGTQPPIATTTPAAATATPPAVASAGAGAAPSLRPHGILTAEWWFIRDFHQFDDLILAFKSFLAGGGAGAISKTVVAPAERYAADCVLRCVCCGVQCSR